MYVGGLIQHSNGLYHMLQQLIKMTIWLLMTLSLTKTLNECKCFDLWTNLSVSIFHRSDFKLYFNDTNWTFVQDKGNILRKGLLLDPLNYLASVWEPEGKYSWKENVTFPSFSTCESGFFRKIIILESVTLLTSFKDLPFRKTRIRLPWIYWKCVWSGVRSNKEKLVRIRWRIKALNK